MLATPRRPVARWHPLKDIKVEKKTVGFLPKRGNLSKAFSLEVTDARSSIHRLKRLASVDQGQGSRLRAKSLAESSEGGSTGDLGGSQGSGLQELGQVNRGS